MRKLVLGVAFLFLFWAPQQAFSQSPFISLSPSSFSFNAIQSGSVPVSQTLQITNTGGGTLNWLVSEARNSDWLSATPGSGTAAPTSNVTVSITRTNLPPGTYVDTLVVTSGSASNSPQRVPLTYTVSAPPQPAVISLSPTSFNFSATQSGPLPLTQNLQITNGGTGSLNWTVFRARNSAWLSATPGSGTAPSAVIVSITTTGLVPNTYYDTLVISSGSASNSPQRVPVTYTVSPPPQPAVISLSPLSFNFSAVQSGPVPSTQNLQITNTGGGTLNWSVSKKHNASWLSATPGNGTAPGAVIVAITTTGLVPNTYVDTLIISGNASNSPQQVPVTYTVSTPPTPAVISVSPTSFSFTAVQSGLVPSTQNLQITNTGGGTLNWSVSKKHNASWLSATPGNGTAPSNVIVAITTTGLVPNTYVDTLVISGNAGNSPQEVPVIYTVSTPPTPAEIFVSPASFDFSAIQSGPVPFTQELQINNAGGGTLNWSISKAHNSVWLAATPVNGTAPSAVNVAITTTGLVPNTYYDTLVLTSGDASNSPQRVPVAYTVTAPITATISFSPPSFSFNAVQSGPLPSSQTLQISNSGSGTLNWSINSNLGEPFIDMDGDGKYNPAVDRFITCNCPENQDLNFNSMYDGVGAPYTSGPPFDWLAPTPVSGTAPYSVTVAITRTNLPPGTHPGKLTILGNATNSPQEVTVTYTVFPAPSILAAPESLVFTANEGGANPASQLIFIDVSDPSISWSVSKSQAWLGLTPVADTGNGQVGVSVNLSGLVAGDYFDTVVVTALSAANSPRSVPVHLHLSGPVLSPASLQISPTQLDFYAQRFDTIPSQTIDISNDGQLPLNWSATILHAAAWLSISPLSGTDDGTITVSAATDLSPLTYVDTIKIEAPGALNAPRFIPVRLNVTTAVGDEPGNRPRSFALSQNYPNPFNPTTKIDFALPRFGHATLEVFNVVGQRIRVLLDGEMPAGRHSEVWDGRDAFGRVVGSGIYFYRLKSQNFSDIKRMVLLK